MSTLARVDFTVKILRNKTLWATFMLLLMFLLVQ